MKTLRFILIAGLMLLGLPAPAVGLGDTPLKYKAGFRSVSVADREQELISSIAVWYPSARKSRTRYSVSVGGWRFEAERNAKPAAGRFPVILLSHGMAGHNLANHDLALNLAGNGFVVIAPTHYGDNDDNAAAMLSAALFFHRPRQLAAALHNAAMQEELREVMDLNRIGLLGCGSGAITVLQLAGAVLDPGAGSAYCAANPTDQAFCNSWAAQRLNKLPGDAAEITAKYGLEAFTPSLRFPLPASARGQAKPPGDQKLQIRAVGLLAPGGLFMLRSLSLASLSLPLGAVFAEEDEFFPPPRSNEELADIFPPPQAGLVRGYICRRVDHYSLAAPCPEALADTAPSMCGQAEPGDRESAARERDEFFSTFFRQHLGGPEE